MNFFPVILAGGSGTRLWPLSRKDFPKQFLQLYGTQYRVGGAYRKCQDGILVILPSDHWIDNEAAWQDAINAATACARQHHFQPQSY